MAALGKAGISRLLECGVSTVTLPGEQHSGDLHLITPFARGMLVAVVDGAGHGREAAAAAEIAIRVLGAHPAEGIPTLVRRCHDKLRGTRGAVMGLAAFDGIANTMSWLGIGNIEAVLLRRDSPGRKPLLVRAGLVGYRLPSLHVMTTSISREDLLIVTTDGIRPNSMDVSTDGDPNRIAEGIASNHLKGTDDGLVMVARYIGWPG
jgi:negative regulator of sigma-B (phosphoserine phosphatase)